MEVNDILINFQTYIDELLHSAGIFAPLLACLFIIIEAILPFLPLFVFISINFLAFGSILGFIISWIFTIIGSMLVFILIRKGFHSWFTKYIQDKNKLSKTYEYVNKLKFTQLTMIIAIPFTPSFFVNIAAGLTDISIKKYFTSLAIGKLFAVYFWGFIGSSLVESLTDLGTIIKIILMILGAYIISYLLNKKLKINY